MEQTALNLKALLMVLSATDSDNIQAMAEMPHALTVAADMAEQLYCMIVSMKTGVK